MHDANDLPDDAEIASLRHRLADVQRRSLEMAAEYRQIADQIHRMKEARRRHRESEAEQPKP